jgi:hypothetical protein
MECAVLPASIAIAALLVPDSGGFSARQKIELIQEDRVPRGSVVRITEDELNAYVRSEVSKAVRQGVRDPRVKLGDGRASGYAYIDFPLLRRSMGSPMNWLMAMLLAGERAVRVDARIRSSGGWAVVHVDRVEISGLVISGATLDYLIRNFLLPRYPQAKIGKPFELAHHIERIEVVPSAVRVVIGK